MKLLKDKQKERYNVAARPLFELQPGDPICVMMLTGCSTWKCGICKQKVALFSYNVINGTTYCPNRYHICCDTIQPYKQTIEHIDP